MTLRLASSKDPGLRTDLTSDLFRRVMYGHIYRWADKHRPIRKMLEVSGTAGLGLFRPDECESTTKKDLDLTTVGMWGERSFDLVFADQVLEHVDDVEFALIGLRSLTRKGGWAVATVPFFMPLHDVSTGDYRRFTPQGLNWLFSQSFDEVEVWQWGNREAARLAIDWPITQSMEPPPGLLETNEPGFPVVLWVYAR